MSPYQSAGENMADDQEQLRQHWQQLAEQLGLDAPGQPATAPTPVPIKEKRPTASKMDQAEKAEPSEAQTEREGTFVRNDDKTFGASEAEAAPAKAPAPDQFVAVAETSAGAVSDPAEPPIDEPRPERRGRRERRPERGERGKSSHRRRDSGPRRREEASLPAERAENLLEMNGPEDSSEPELPEEIEPAFVDETSSAEERKQDDEVDNDDVDTLSDWNVPSWAELIASLYRPER